MGEKYNLVADTRMERHVLDVGIHENQTFDILDNDN